MKFLQLVNFLRIRRLELKVGTRMEVVSRLESMTTTSRFSLVLRDVYLAKNLVLLGDERASRFLETFLGNALFDDVEYGEYFSKYGEYLLAILDDYEELIESRAKDLSKMQVPKYIRGFLPVFSLSELSLP